jgi:hypothetical protein
MNDSRVPKVEYILEMFSKKDESYIGKHRIRGLNLEDLQKLFKVPSDNPMYDCFPVNESHVKKLEVATGQQIDLSKVDCFVTGACADD